MIRCPKCSSAMDAVLTRASVIIDVCKSCQGVFLDQGEINFFAKNKKMLSEYDTHGLQDPKPSIDRCPRCNEAMRAGKIPQFRYEIEECSSCRGIFLDGHEFKKIRLENKFSGFKEDQNINLSQPEVTTSAALHPARIKLPSLGTVSMLVLGSMYAILFGVIVFFVEAGVLQYNAGILLLLGFIALQFFLGPIIMDWSLKLFGSLDWIPHDKLPTHLRQSLLKLCNQEKIPLPRFGIIRDGSPQAYTYGRTPWSARVVFSEGIFKLLNEDEVEAVLAHELGHVKHWDFVVMTLAQLVPILLYHLYRMCRQVSKSKRSSRSKNDGRAYFAVAALVAYVAYVITDYLVMFISRLREYYADRFSSFSTKNPNSLQRALIKIGFGLVASNRDEPTNSNSNEKKKMAVQSMGIMNVSGSKEVAIALQGDSSRSHDPSAIKEVMRWDLWSPWATYFEFHSTHPLTAKRINAIGTYSRELQQEPFVEFDLEKPESYWDDFFQDLIVLFLPYLVAMVLTGLYAILFEISNGKNLITPAAIGFALGGIYKTLRQYPGGGFLNHSVLSLLKKIKVSPVRSFPVKLKGHIIGRGDAGNIFAEDMVLRDRTGIIFLDHEPFGFNFFFALFRMNKFRGQDVEIDGWYRRAPIPYVEVRKISTTQTSSSSYTFYYKIIGWIIIGKLGALAPFFI